MFGEDFFEYFIFFYSTSLIASYLMLAIFSMITIIRYKNYNSNLDDETLYNSDIAPGISVVAPAYNEEKTIITNVHSLLTLEYPLFEVVIVNDGSKDTTLEKLIKEFDLVEVPYAYIERIKTQPVKKILKSTNPSDCLKTMPSLPIIFQDMIFGMFIFKVWNINKDKTGNSSAFTQPA